MQDHDYEMTETLEIAEAVFRPPPSHVSLPLPDQRLIQASGIRSQQFARAGGWFDQEDGERSSR